MFVCRCLATERLGSLNLINTKNIVVPMRNTIGIFPPGGLPGTCIPGSHSMKIGVNFFISGIFFWSGAWHFFHEPSMLSYLICLRAWHFVLRISNIGKMPWLTFSANPRELVNTTLTKKLWQPGPPLQLRTHPPPYGSHRDPRS